MFVNNDCLSVILNYLCYVDQMSLKLTCHNRIVLNFKNIFIHRLIQDKIVSEALTNTFCNELYRTGSYVAGSFILDCLYDTNNHNDIDIYDQTSLQAFERKQISFVEDCFAFEGKQISFVEDCFGFKEYNKDNLQFTQSLYKMGFFAKCNNCGPDPLIRNFTHPLDARYQNNVHSNYENVNDKNKIPIGLTPKNEKSFIPRFINASFDLEICQSIFDGQKLYIKNVNKIIQKYDYIKPNTRFMLTVYPYQIKDIKDVTNKRMEKYQEKGFNIQKHPKFDEINQHIKDII